MEVKDFALEQVTLVLPMGSDIAVGDSFDIIAGCDKTASICSGPLIISLILEAFLIFQAQIKC